MTPFGRDHWTLGQQQRETAVARTNRWLRRASLATVVTAAIVALLQVLLLLQDGGASVLAMLSPVFAMLVGLYWSRQLFRRSLDMEAFHGSLRVDSTLSRAERTDSDHSLLALTLVLHATALSVVLFQLWRELK